jgi:hypothetical protein
MSSLGPPPHPAPLRVQGVGCRVWTGWMADYSQVDNMGPVYKSVNFTFARARDPDASRGCESLFEPPASTRVSA